MTNFLYLPLRLFLLVFFCHLPSQAFRPFNTDDAGTASPGSFELELSGDYFEKSETIGCCLTHGITQNMDIGIALGHCIHPYHKSTFDHAELGLKFAFVPNLVSASFTGVFGDPSYSTSIILSPLTGPLSLHINTGFTTTADTTLLDLTYGFASVFTRGRMSAGVEIGGTHKNLNWWQFGMIFAMTKTLTVDTGIGGNSFRAPSITLAFGLLLAFSTSRQGPS